MNETEELLMLRDMLEHMPGGAFTYEADGDQRFIYVSPSLVKLLGYEDEESFLKSVNYSFINFVHHEDYEKIQQEIDEQIS
ncbi:MAG: PAS domain S-box protein, partial [Bacilli bacterium]|nr:PAS domain S-box protein [Bacilli bacterium]